MATGPQDTFTFFSKVFQLHHKVSTDYSRPSRSWRRGPRLSLEPFGVKQIGARPQSTESRSLVAGTWRVTFHLFPYGLCTYIFCFAALLPGRSPARQQLCYHVPVIPENPSRLPFPATCSAVDSDDILAYLSGSILNLSLPTDLGNCTSTWSTPEFSES